MARLRGAGHRSWTTLPRRSNISTCEHQSTLGGTPARSRAVALRPRPDRQGVRAALDVEALARGAHMSAGHLSREFRLAYGEAPYSYLMTRRIERAMALLRRGDLSVTEVCFAVGCSLAGHLQQPVHRAGRRAAQRLPAPGGPHDVGDAILRGETGHQTGQESRSAGPGAATSMSAMDINIHASFLPHNDPDAALAFYRDTLGFEVRNDVGYGGMRWITVGPADQPGTSIVLEPPAADPGITDDERRTIAEMMAKGTYARSSWPPRTSTAPSTGCRPAAPRSSRNRRTSRTGCATAPSAIPPAT